MTLFEGVWIMQNNLDKIKRKVSGFLFWLTPRFYFCRDVTMILWMDLEFILPKEKM